MTKNDKKMTMYCLEPSGNVFQAESDTQAEENVRVFVDEESLEAYKMRQFMKANEKYEWKAMSDLFKEADDAKLSRVTSIQNHYDAGWKMVGGALRREKR
jgi:hypothetical protein